MGYIYCFSNESMPDIYKIGMTDRSPHDRLKDANTADTFRPPTKYVIQKYITVTNAKKIERFIHKILCEKRVDPKKEFFKCDYSLIENIFNLINNLTDVDQPEVTNDETSTYFERFTNLHILEKKDSIMFFNDAFSNYSEWIKSFETNTKLSRTQFKTLFTKKYGEYNNEYKGYQLSKNINSS